MTPRTVYLVHGFNVRDAGAATTDRLAPLFSAAGYRVRELDYGFFGLLRVRWCTPGIARAIARTLLPDSIVVAHSHGASVVYKTAQQGCRFSRAVLINPALDSDKTIPGAASVQTWYSRHDVPTGLARLVPFSSWGSQGRTGYTGDNPLHENFNEGLLFGGRIGHSDAFRRAARLKLLATYAMEGLPP